MFPADAWQAPEPSLPNTLRWAAPDGRRRPLGQLIRAAYLLPVSPSTDSTTSSGKSVGNLVMRALSPSRTAAPLAARAADWTGLSRTRAPAASPHRAAPTVQSTLGRKAAPDILLFRALQDYCMKCTVIGGGGFIGSHLVSSLLARGFRVTVFDRPEARYLSHAETAGARLISGDFTSARDVRQSLSDCDVVYHLASATVPGTSNENPIHDVQANILGTVQLLEEARKAKVSKIVFASSGGTIYGIPNQFPISESHPTEPITAYGIGKLAVEKYLQLYKTLYGLEYCILRTSNAYGEREPTSGIQGVIGSFLRAVRQAAEPVVWGDGSAVRDYVYVGDVAHAFAKAATYAGEPRVFNIGSGQGHSLNEVIGLIERIIQRPLHARYMPARPFDVPANVLDISRAKKFLDWQPTLGLFEGISRTYEWMLNDSEKYDGTPSRPNRPG